MASISTSPPPPPPPSITLHRRRCWYYSSISISSPWRRKSISSSLFSSRPPSSYSSSSSASGDGPHDLHLLPSQSRRSPGAAVYVTVPADSVDYKTGGVTRRKAMAASFLALASAGVEGVTIELWWGVVEREGPMVYDWKGYGELIDLAKLHGLKVRAIMAFHQCSGNGPGDPCWIPLPCWVLEEMQKEPDLAYSDRFGRRSKEYISLGCDGLPLLRGRSPVQAYSDVMRSFRDKFRHFLGVVITEIQVGMGPAGELRYPSVPSEKLRMQTREPVLGEFQCYDKYMLASLNANACKVGMREWGNGGPLGASNLLQNPEETSFFKNEGSWNTAYGRFFLEWYSGMLLLHGERLCVATEAIFWGAGVRLSGKVGACHWHYLTTSHPSELTAGYYNTIVRDGYLPIARLFARNRMMLCCTCFDLRDVDIQGNPKSSPEGFLRQLAFAARMCNLPLIGENSVTCLDDTSLQQAIKSSQLYSASPCESSLSFNYMRMDRHLFNPNNWNRFARFVRQMSDARTFQAKHDFRVADSCFHSISASEDLGRNFSYH